jgi:hypothetical protein
MKRTFFTLAATVALAAGIAHADDRDNDRDDSGRLDHVWMIMMENHGYNQIIGNPYAPFTNAEAKYANLATNYFAVGHPSLTNYLETVGGSNFGVRDDNSPDWHNASCKPNIATGAVSLESNSTAICPIYGVGTDAATPALDTTNETSGPPPVIDVDGTVGYTAAHTVGQTIADQLIARGMSWKSYQESLPLGGADGVNNSDGNFSNLTQFTADEQAQGDTSANVVALYAVKHNPFLYFRSIQESPKPLENVVGFDGLDGLYGDLQSGQVPNFSFIVPNQCNDQHGRGNAGPFCNFDPADNGTQNGLNPALITLGDNTVQKIVTAIKGSDAWHKGNNAIVITWDENDYSVSPTNNKVVTIVDTNHGPHGKTSAKFYTHFSLLRTLEAGFGLPCLNHACDATSKVMSDMFGSAF